MSERTIIVLVCIVLALFVFGFGWELYLRYFVYGNVVLTPIEKLVAYWKPTVCIVLGAIGLYLLKYISLKK